MFTIILVSGLISILVLSLLQQYKTKKNRKSFDFKTNIFISENKHNINNDLFNEVDEGIEDNTLYYDPSYSSVSCNIYHTHDESKH
jgi:hypothetical protein